MVTVCASSPCLRLLLLLLPPASTATPSRMTEATVAVIARVFATRWLRHRVSCGGAHSHDPEIAKRR